MLLSLVPVKNKAPEVEHGPGCWFLRDLWLHVLFHVVQGAHLLKSYCDEVKVFLLVLYCANEIL